MKYNKYIKQKLQVSNDGGLTWSDVVPSETRKGDLIGGFNSYDEAVDGENNMLKWLTVDITDEMLNDDKNYYIFEDGTVVSREKPTDEILSNTAKVLLGYYFKTPESPYNVSFKNCKELYVKDNITAMSWSPSQIIRFHNILKLRIPSHLTEFFLSTHCLKELEFENDVTITTLSTYSNRSLIEKITCKGGLKFIAEETELPYLEEILIYGNDGEKIDLSECWIRNTNGKIYVDFNVMFNLAGRPKNTESIFTSKVCPLQMYKYDISKLDGYDDAKCVAIDMYGNIHKIPNTDGGQRNITKGNVDKYFYKGNENNRPYETIADTIMYMKINEGVENIEKNAFVTNVIGYMFYKLVTLELPSTLKRLDYDSIPVHTQYLIFKGETPPSFSVVFLDSNFLNGVNKIYVPDNSVDAYKAAINWGQMIIDKICPVSEYGKH